MTKPNIAIGLLGPTLDMGKGPSRWERWRPTVSVCQHEDLLISRFDLLYQARYATLMRSIVRDIGRVSPETAVVCHKIKFTDPWDFEEVYGALHDFTQTYPFNPDGVQYLIHISTGTHVAQICLYLLTEAAYMPGKLLQTGPSGGKMRGNPAGEYRIIDLDLSKYDRIAMRFRRQMDDDASYLKSGIETLNTAYNELIEKIERVATKSEEPILLTGPTGAGKSRLAKRIYQLKKARRKIQGNWVEVNCATLRGDAAMSALFGHTKGAFTGAAADRKGLLRTADGGMLFLDEVGELGVDEQSMLLRAIEEKRFLPVGSDQESESDFQLICGTNRDLKERVRKGRFREDLLSRINLWTFELPGLGRRREDIEPNLQYELDRFSQKNNMHVTFNAQARAKFLSFAVSDQASWPANFRDLKGAVKRMATLSLSGRITLEVVAEEIERLRRAWKETQMGTGEDVLKTLLDPEIYPQLDRFDKAQLADVIRVCRQSRNMSEAGRRLFSESRKRKTKPNDADRLRKYLSKFKLRWRDIGSNLE
jgi:transcriptional regulatory protein RtcR